MYSPVLAPTESGKREVQGARRRLFGLHNGKDGVPGPRGGDQIRAGGTFVRVPLSI